MSIVYLLLIAAGGLVLLWSAGEKGSLVERIGRFLHKKYIILAGGKQSRYSRMLEDELALLKPGSDRKQAAAEYVERRMGEGFLAVWICCILALALHIQMEMTGRYTEGMEVERAAHGAGSRQMEFMAQSGGREECVELEVAEREYTETEIQDLLEQFLAILDRQILGDNVSPDEIRTALSLPQQVEGFPFQIRWEGDEKNVIHLDGSLENEELEAEGVITNLSAEISYQDFTTQYTLALHVLPPVCTEMEVFQKKLQKLAETAEQGSRERKVFELPGQLDGEAVIWKEKKEDWSGLFVLFGLMAAGAFYYGREEDRKKQLAEREKGLCNAYPELVMRMALFLGAGMTVRSAFYRIAKEEKDAGSVLGREMQAACHEMEMGISESQAYLHFGKRCCSRQYMKFSTLLMQNLKKGSRGLVVYLEKEACEALEERKSQARQRGEEVGTKLLLPMAGMLVFMMLVIVVPAYGSFGI